jgi:type I restriction enzyme S subunit
MKWKMVKIPEVLFFQEGPGVRKWQFKNRGVKLLNVGNINHGILNLSKTSVFLSEEEANGKYSHFLVEEGDLLIACSGIIISNFHNKIAYAKKEHLPLCMNTSTMRFRPLDNRILLDYYKYVLQTNTFTSQLRKLITGSAQLNFGPSHIKKIKIPLPPLDIQQQIAEILDTADALRRSTAEQLQQLDDLAQSVFLEMFGDTIKNSKDFPIKKLKDISKIARGKFSIRPRNDPRYFNGKYPYVQTGDITKSNHRLSKYHQTLNEKGIKVSKEFKKGTIVIAIVGATIGATAILEIDTYAPDSIIGIEVHKNFSNAIYIENLLRYWKPVFLAKAPATARANINIQTLNPLPIPIPPLELQTQFAKIIENIEVQKQELQSALQESEDLFNGLLQEIFS